jgi:hypothetical protein
MHHLTYTALLLDCPLSATNRLFHSNISVSNPLYLAVTVSWMEIDSETYDGWLWIARNWGQQSLYLMFKKYSATSRHFTRFSISFTPKIGDSLRNVDFFQTSGRSKDREYFNLFTVHFLFYI